jgi:hypothetical protein
VLEGNGVCEWEMEDCVNMSVSGNVGGLAGTMLCVVVLVEVPMNGGTVANIFSYMCTESNCRLIPGSL